MVAEVNASTDLIGALPQNFESHINGWGQDEDIIIPNKFLGGTRDDTTRLKKRWIIKRQLIQRIVRKSCHENSSQENVRVALSKVAS